MATVREGITSELTRFKIMSDTAQTDRTRLYFEALERSLSHLYDLKTVDFSAYSQLISNLPGDLACKLRLVPDEHLSARLSHLMEIYKACVKESYFSFSNNLSIVSIEGSNSNLMFDADLILLCDDTKTMYIIDFTSSNNPDVLFEKKSKIEANITANSLKHTKAVVQKFISTNIAVDIDLTFVSSEPGTEGLKIIDSFCNFKDYERVVLNSTMKRVYDLTNTTLATLEYKSAPGDYKEKDFTSDFIDRAERIVKTQQDLDSLNFLIDSSNVDEGYFPYMKSLAKIAKNSRVFQKLTHLKPSETFEPRDLQSNLSSLASNPFCRALHAATLSDNVVALDDSDNIEFLSDFPCAKSDDVIPSSLLYKVCIKYKAGHVFEIKHNANYMEENLRRVVLNTGDAKDKSYKVMTDESDEDLVRRYITDAIMDYSQDIDSGTQLMASSPKDNIWKKIMTISALASNDLDNFGRSTTAMLDHVVDFIDKLQIGGSIAHYYEVCKTILASLKVSPSNNEYYVGVNGPYKSLTIVKMSSTLDSFSKTNYSVIYEPVGRSKMDCYRLKGSFCGDTFQTNYYSIDPNLLSYFLKLPFTAVSLATWEIENNMENGAIQENAAPRIIIDSFIHSLVNRDHFAQAASQIRYFYMSSIGYGGSSADITDKVDTLFIHHSWEALYIMRSFKVAACLSSISTMKRLSNIEDPNTRELAVVFPHTTFPSKSFSQTISSMYLSNVFNKFRAFHEVSEAICYMSIVEEIGIYNSRVSKDVNAVSGISPIMSSEFKKGPVYMKDYIFSEQFIQDEVEFNVNLAKIKSNRYSGSMSYMIGATISNSLVGSGIVDSIYARLSCAPIEATTMKGSMDVGESTKEPQGMRAASTMLENLIRVHGKDPRLTNKNVLGAATLFDEMSKTDKSMSIFSSVMRQVCSEHDPYRYRIIEKDQIGHREVSVLNHNFRLGGLFVETISRELSRSVGDVDVVHNPNKDKIVEDAIKDSFKSSTDGEMAYCYDNSDQKRWGPNHNMNFFAYMMYGMLFSDPGLVRLVLVIFDKTFDKRAKFPEQLIKMYMIKGVKKSESGPISEFFEKCGPMMDNQIFELHVPQGMCQGIYHDTSSVCHAIKSKAMTDVCYQMSTNIRLKCFTTSDDAETIIGIKYNSDRIDEVKKVHVAGLRVGNLFNIVRSNPKSAFNFLIAELNSIFYKRGVMATPSLKQRISKIDVGFGINHIEDYLTSMSASANYLAQGGSYMGTYILTILNFTLHTEQWLRWKMAKSDYYYRPVEMGGFPVIEPLSTIISGGSSNLYMRACAMMSAENYSRLLVNTLLCPPERLSLADFTRSGSEQTKKSFADDNVTVYKGTGPFGLFSTVRTDRQLSMFERRHGISKWMVPDSFASLDRNSPSAKDFLFAIFRNTSVSTLDTNLGVNSFFIRFAEPWVSYYRKCFKVRVVPFCVTTRWSWLKDIPSGHD